MKRKLAIVLVIVLAMMVVFVGCGGGEETSADKGATDNGSVMTEPPVGIQLGTEINMYGNMDFVAQQFPGQVPPAQWMYGYIYDTLFYAVDGDNANMDGLLAKDWEISEDGKTWVINLYENVTFCNGNKLNAESIVGTFNFTRKFQEAVFAQIENYEATGEYQVTFQFRAPMPEFMRQFALPHMGILDHTQIAELGETLEAAYKVGSGPYYVDSFAVGDYMIFKANENYWKEDRMPHIETINLKIILDPTTQSVSLQTGEMDYGQVGDFNNFETIEGHDGLNLVQTLGANRCLYFNATGLSPYLKNPKVRQAISMMVDMEQVNLAATGGHGEVIHNAFNTSFNHNDGYTFDPEGALKILEEEGINPEDIKLSALVDAGTESIYNNVQAQLISSGIFLEYSVQDIPAVMTLGIKGQWDVWSEHGGMTHYAYISPVNMLLSDRAVFNVFNDEKVEPEIWDLVRKANTVKTFEEEKAKLEDVAAVLGDNFAYIGNVQLPMWNAFSKRVQNIVLDNSVGYWLPWYSYVTE